MTHYKDELDELLIEKLTLLEEAPPRDPTRASYGRNAYLKMVRNLQLGSPFFSFANFLSSIPRKIIFRQQPAWVPMTAALLLIIGLVFGSWGTAQAAQNSLPNDFLYTVKLTGEDLRLALTFDADARISLLTTYTDRRVAEANALVSQGGSVPAALTELLEKQYDALFAAIANLDEAAMSEALNGIQIHLRDQDRDMTNTMKGLPEDRDPQLVQLRSMLNARQKLAQMGLGDPNTFQNRLRFQFQTLPITGTLTTTLSTTPGISVTHIIIPGYFGPGPCEIPGECDPLGYGSGPFEGIPPVSEGDAGYGPGPGAGEGPQDPTEPPMPGEPPQDPAPLPNDPKLPKNGDSKKKP